MGELTTLSQQTLAGYGPVYSLAQAPISFDVYVLLVAQKSCLHYFFVLTFSQNK